MIASNSAGRMGAPAYIAGLFMPYFTVGLGLHIFHSAWAAIFAYHAGILLILCAAGFKRLSPFRLTIPIWKLLSFAGLGAGAGVMLAFLWPYLFVSPALPQTLQQWGLTRMTWPFFIIYFALANPWLEELYWRGWLGSDARPPVPNDAFFAGFHLVILAPFISSAWLIVSFTILVLTGWMWRQIARRSRSLLPAALFHLAADVSILIAIVSEAT